MVSIILPAYKSAITLKNQLPGFIDFMKQKQIHHEIIIVDDGSDDHGETQNVAQAYGCTYLALEKNTGKGAAVRKGVFHASGEFILFTDADIPFSYDSMLHFLHYLDYKEFDLVVGDRTLPDSTYFTKITRSRQLGSSLYSFIVGRFITGGLFDTQCGLKGFRQTVARDIFSVSRIKGFAFDVELLYIALKRNYDIKRLPVTFRCNEGSSVKILKHGLQMLIDIFRIIWFQKTNKYKARPRHEIKS